jgi:hypothetical protein
MGLDLNLLSKNNQVKAIANKIKINTWSFSIALKSNFQAPAKGCNITKGTKVYNKTIRCRAA